MEDIQLGFKTYGGFNMNKPLMVVVDEKKLIELSKEASRTGEGTDWVKAFLEDPHAAASAFSDPDVLFPLLMECLAIIIDGAHRW